MIRVYPWGEGTNIAHANKKNWATEYFRPSPNDAPKDQNDKMHKFARKISKILWGSPQR